MPGRRYRHLWIEAEDSESNPVRAVTYIADGNAVGGKPSLCYIILGPNGKPRISVGRLSGAPRRNFEAFTGCGGSVASFRAR